MNENTLNDRNKELVRNRLVLVDKISSLRVQFTGVQHIKETPDGGWTNTWREFDGLRNYLLLTCFDLLGQPAAWVTFDEWLSSSTKREERMSAAKSVMTRDVVDICKEMLNVYTKRYGVRTSFYRFMDLRISASVKAELLYSVRIRKIDRELNREIEVVNDEAKKKQFLYELRNSFTHKGVVMGNVIGGIIDQIGRAHV